MRSLPNVIKPSQYQQEVSLSPFICAEEPQPDAEDNEIPEEPVAAVMIDSPQDAVTQALKKAKEILDAADAYSAKKKQELSEQVNQGFADAREKGRQEGYDVGEKEGVLEGQKAGYRKGYEKGLADASAAADQTLDCLRIVLNTLQNEREHVAAQEREDLTKLVVSIAESVLSAKLDKDAGAISTIIEKAVENQLKQEWIHVYVSREAYDRFQKPESAFLDRMQSLCEGCRIYPNSQLKTGDCLIELPGEVWDVGTTTQIAKVKAVLSQT